MFIRARPRAQARMPSMRQPSLGLRLPPAPSPASTVVNGAPAKATAAAAVIAPVDGADAPNAPGGFHESSYELQHGLQITESAWPDDVTVPGRLGEH